MGASGDEELASTELLGADTDLARSEEMGSAVNSEDSGFVEDFFAPCASATHGGVFPVVDGGIIVTNIAARYTKPGTSDSL